MKQKTTHEKSLSQRLMMVVMILSLFISACDQDGPQDSAGASPPAQNMEDVEVPSDFNFETTSDIQLNLKLEAPDGTALQSVKVDIYNDKLENGGNIIASGLSDESGNLALEVTVPTYLDSMSVRPNYIGLIPEAYIATNQSEINITIGGPNETVFNPETETASSLYQPNVVSYWEEWYEKLGTWDRRGVPNYLEKKRDNITKDFLEDLNASLPEGKAVNKTNPEYLVEKDMNTKLKENADVWITFVHEGADWLNSLGFYTYDLNNPPSSPEDIDSLLMVFPNVSYRNSGGDLKSGDKVKIGTFKAGTGIGWFLVPQGWNPWFQTVIKSNQIKWSVKDFNTYSSEQYAQHMVALKDNKRELILLGFEDTSRPSGDNDFNDCIFYVTANPFTAVVTDDIQNIKTKVDTDKDGVDDYSDEYPEDPERAYNKYSPAKDVFGTLAYEDLWPSKGDYDFNDIVVDYNHKMVMSAKNKVVEMTSTFKTRAIGGAYKNGFGYVLNMNPNKVKSVKGTSLTESIITTNANGTESGQSKAVIIVYDNAFAHMSPVSGYTVNAVKGSPFVTPHVSEVSVEFVNPVSTSQLGTWPFNPFIISNKQRGVEIHLPGQQPSDLVDKTLFGTEDDASNSSRNMYFKTKKNHPWAVHIPETFDYPSEKSDIVNAYYYFETWAESGGKVYPDWYKDKDIYRNNDYIY